MTSVSRSAQFAKVFKILKKHYQPVPAHAERPVLEHLLFACCLEDAHYGPAEESLAALVHTFFDWNEIRVTSVTELSEVLAGVPDPRAAANRVKRVLQSVFETAYSFDLEDRRKKNLGPTIKWLEKLDGTTGFTVAYIVQAALGGHAIPVDAGTLRALRVVDLVSDKDVTEGVVPGLERAIAKSKGVEFGSLLHQLGADFTANPYAPAVRKILLEINPDAKDHLPRRRAAVAEAADGEAGTEGADAVQAKAPSGPSGARAKTAKAAPSPPPEEPTPTAAKKSPARKKSAGQKEKPPEQAPVEEPHARKKRSTSEGLSKRKPR